MNGHEVVRRILAQHGMEDVAREVAELYAEREEAAPKNKAREFELGYLLEALGGSEVAEAAPAATWKRVQRSPHWWRRPDSAESERGSYLVVPITPRVVSLLRGDLPSERGYR